MADRIDYEVKIKEPPRMQDPFPEYIHVFPNGKEFRVERRSDDTYQITLRGNNGGKFDFEVLLPRGYKFVSMEYIDALDDPETTWNPWFTDHKRKEIYVGEFEDAKDILGLLHEIGHAGLEANSEERRKWKEFFAELGMEDKLYSVLIQEEMAKLESVIERHAWAYALLAMRFLGKKFGLDSKSIFPNSSSAINYINSELKTYRETNESLIEDDPTFKDELIKLFDRGIQVKENA